MYSGTLVKLAYGDGTCCGVVHHARYFTNKITTDGYFEDDEEYERWPYIGMFGIHITTLVNIFKWANELNYTHFCFVEVDIGNSKWATTDMDLSTADRAMVVSSDDHTQWAVRTLKLNGEWTPISLLLDNEKSNIDIDEALRWCCKNNPDEVHNLLQEGAVPSAECIFENLNMFDILSPYIDEKEVVEKALGRFVIKGDQQAVDRLLKFDSTIVPHESLLLEVIRCHDHKMLQRFIWTDISHRTDALELACICGDWPTIEVLLNANIDHNCCKAFENIAASYNAAENINEFKTYRSNVYFSKCRILLPHH